MESKQQRLQSRIGRDIVEFRQQQKTLQMATLTENGKPHVSYTPFVYLSSGYYILISDIAKHGKNLKGHQKVSIMMIEDEQDAKSIYARKRLSFDATASLIHRESDAWLEAINALEQRFGEIVCNLSKLGDFCLYQLIPEKGRFVKGFGKAFDVTGSDLVDIVHLDEGHIKNN